MQAFCKVALAFLLVTPFALTSGVATQAAAQELALAKRAPRFLYAASRRAEPVEVDASRTVTLRRVVSLNIERPTVGRLLTAIERQTGLKFAFTKAAVETDRPVELRAEAITVGGALLAILMDMGVDVLLSSGAQIALVERREGRSTVATGSIAGRVSDKATGAPLTGATVAVDGAPGRTTTDGNGRYHLSDIPVGPITVRARYIGYAPTSVSATVTSNAEVVVDFALARSAQKLDEMVTVTPGGIQTQAKAVPTPVSVITAEDIERQHPATLASVFRQAVPSGVSANLPEQPTTVRFSARGASSLSGLGVMKVFVDGIETSSFDVTGVDPASVERIEVIRGPQAATVYGSDAVAGVVQITTKRGGAVMTQPQIQVQALGGAVQTPYAGAGSAFRQQYTASMRGGGVDVSYNFGAGYTRLADWLPDGEISRQSSPSVYGGIQYSKGILTADFHGRYSRNDLPQVRNPEFLNVGLPSLSRPQFSPQTFTNETYGARLSVSPTTWWRNQLTAGIDHVDQDMRQVQRRLTTPADTLLQMYEATGRKVSLFFNSSATTRLGANAAGSLTAGIDHYRLDATTFSTANALKTEGTIETDPPGAFSEGRATITNTGYFAQTELNWREAVFITAGLRAEHNSTFGADLSTPVAPRIGLSAVGASGNLTVKARVAYGRAIRAPSPGQAFGEVGATLILLANPLLRPERQQGWDGGVDFVFGSRGSLSVTGFTQTAKDLIAFLQVGSTPLPTYQYQNVGRVANRGIELEGTLVAGPVELRAQYAYVRSRVEDLGTGVTPGAQVQPGDRPLGAPAHTAGASATAVLLPGTTVAAGLTYVGSVRQLDFLTLARCFGGTGPCRPTPRDYVVDYPAFAKVSLTVTQQLSRRLDALLTVDNLTNNVAFEGVNTVTVMGRTTMFGVRARL